jgi:hypothetical protein
MNGRKTILYAGEGMKDTYIALGVTPSGNALVHRPIVPGGRDGFAFHTALCDWEAKGFTEAGKLLGQMLISALGAFQAEVKSSPLLPEPPSVIPFPTEPPLIDPLGEMRRLRLGLGLGRDASGPAVLIQTLDYDEPYGEAYLQSLKHLADLGTSAAPSAIGEIMLRKLAAMHPDVLPPLFPAIPL